MPEIITFGHEPSQLLKKLGKQSFIKVLLDWFNGLDKFSKLFLVSILLFAVVTPSIISGFLIFQPRAQTVLGDIGTAVTSAPQVSTTSTTGTPTVTTQASSCSTSTKSVTLSIDQQVVTMFGLINQYRLQKGLPTVTADVTLSTISAWMAKDMAANDYFSHTDSLNRSFPQRMLQMGYGCWYSGEILEWNSGWGATGESPALVLNDWNLSPSHRAILIDPNFKAVGIALAYSQTTGKFYWVADFGAYNAKPAVYSGITVTYSTPIPTSTLTKTPSPTINCTYPNSTVCSGACVNVYSDPNNCGSCGNKCLTGLSCVSATCR